jgi:tryptophanyl-tRNA synthetase
MFILLTIVDPVSHIKGLGMLSIDSIFMITPAVAANEKGEVSIMNGVKTVMSTSSGNVIELADDFNDIKQKLLNIGMVI